MKKKKRENNLRRLGHAIEGMCHVKTNPPQMCQERLLLDLLGFNECLLETQNGVPK